VRAVRLRSLFGLAILWIALLVPVLIGGGAGAATEPRVAADDAIAAGRYLVNYGGCNDCHTPGYTQAKGAIPETQRLTGNPVGFQGPWGTSYAINLRLFLNKVPEARWLAVVRKPPFEVHPPMPWANLQALSDADLHAIYAYVNSLGTVGGPMHDFIPPGGTVTSPVIRTTPVTPDPSPH
jgi:mono/diheme cytochrome c family protein